MKNDPLLQDYLSVLQQAIDLKIHEGELVWSRFSGYVVTHTIFLVIIGQILLDHHFKYRVASLILVSIVGFLLGFFWLISTFRGFESVRYWTFLTIELAEKASKKYKIPNIYSRGKMYFIDNREIIFNFEGQDNPTQRSCFTRFIGLNTRGTAYLSIILILLSYSIVFFLAVFGRLN